MPRRKVITFKTNSPSPRLPSTLRADADCGKLRCPLLNLYPLAAMTMRVQQRGKALGHGLMGVFHQSGFVAPESHLAPLGIPGTRQSGIGAAAALTGHGCRRRFLPKSRSALPALLPLPESAAEHRSTRTVCRCAGPSPADLPSPAAEEAVIPAAAARLRRGQSNRGLRLPRSNRSVQSGAAARTRSGHKAVSCIRLRSTIPSAINS